MNLCFRSAFHSIDAEGKRSERGKIDQIQWSKTTKYFFFANDRGSNFCQTKRTIYFLRSHRKSTKNFFHCRRSISIKLCIYFCFGYISAMAFVQCRKKIGKIRSIEKYKYEFTSAILRYYMTKYNRWNESWSKSNSIVCIWCEQNMFKYE